MQNNNYVFKEWHDYLPQAQRICQRRIDRFKNACSGDKKIYFIRSSVHSGQGLIRQEDAIILRDTIKNKYPNLDFCLIIIGYSENCKTSWNLANIKNYYASSELEWKDVWQVILEDINFSE